MSTATPRIDWTRRHMPLLAGIRERFVETKPFDGMTIGFRIHLEPKTAVLVETLLAGGADILAIGNQGTTQFDTVEHLIDAGAVIIEKPGESKDDIRANLATIAAAKPEIVLDNGAELIVRCLEEDNHPIGATEETTSGAILLREQYQERIPFPVIVINDSPLKAIVENKHGVGESTLDEIVRTTNVMLHRKRFVMFGYGWCGRGIAMYARDRGADVTVVEIDPIKALEAAMDGFSTDTAESAAQYGQVFVTATGRGNVIPYELIEAMPDGAILANAGHVDTEIDIPTLHERAGRIESTTSVTRHDLPSGRSVFVLSDGQMVNLAVEGGRGNSIEIMDLGFMLQAMSLERIATGAADLVPGPQPVPADINDSIAVAMLASFD
ncbi:MAG: adenosylhomocysteinase [Armatimonadetes bacterium]|nr:MAG: adenosylhomocysteinase [Armatimonadota bacterium]